MFVKKIKLSKNNKLTDALHLILNNKWKVFSWPHKEFIKLLTYKITTLLKRCIKITSLYWTSLFMKFFFTKYFRIALLHAFGASAARWFWFCPKCEGHKRTCGPALPRLHPSSQQRAWNSLMHACILQTTEQITLRHTHSPRSHSDECCKHSTHASVCVQYTLATFFFFFYF